MPKDVTRVVVVFAIDPAMPDRQVKPCTGRFTADWSTLPPMRVADFFPAWFCSLPLSVHKRTAASYERTFRIHVLPLLGDWELTALRRSTVRNALLAIYATGLAPATVRKCHIALAAMLSAAEAQGYIPENPAHRAMRGLIQRKRNGAAVGKAMTRDQVAQFLETATRVTPRFADLFHTIAGAGLRISEALGLQPAHVDLQNRRLFVCSQWLEHEVDLPKGKRVRYVDLSHSLATRLGRLMQDEPRWLFQNPITWRPWDRSAVHRAMKTVLAEARLPSRFSVHSLRHTWATLALEESNDLVWISRQLGHASLATTTDVYGVGAQPRRLETVDRLDAVLARRGPLRAALPGAQPKQLAR